MKHDEDKLNKIIDHYHCVEGINFQDYVLSHKAYAEHMIMGNYAPEVWELRARVKELEEQLDKTHQLYATCLAASKFW